MEENEITIDEMRALYGQIRGAVNKFNALWPSNVTSGYGWQLPIVRLGDDFRKRLTIPCDPLKDTMAIEQGIIALQRFERAEDQDPSTVFRYPSVFFMSEIQCDLIDEINRLKDHLVHRMGTLNERKRNTFARKAWPGVSTLQLYRQIYYYDEAPRKALFSWVGNTTSVSRALTAEECIEMVQRTLNMVPPSMKREDWSSIIEKEITDIQSMDISTGNFVKMKPIAPHPRLMLYMTEDVKKATHVAFANVPVFVRTSAECEVVELSDFDFSSIKKRAKRKDAKIYKPIIPRLFLYFRPYKQ